MMRLVGALSLIVVFFSGPAPALRPAEAPDEEEKLKERDRYGEETAKLRAEGKIREAIEACGKMLAIEREVFGDLHKDVAGSYEQLAQMREELGEFDAARKCREEVLRIRTKLHGEKDWRATDARLDLEDLEHRSRLTAQERDRLKEAEGLNDQVYALWGQGKSKEALDLAQKQVEIREKIQGKEHRDYALSLFNLAVQYQTMGDHSRAEPLYKQALEIAKKILGEEHPEYANSLNNLGSLYHERGDYPRAEPLYRRALEIKKKALGEEHPEYAQQLNNMAGIYYDMGDRSRAEALMRQALEIWKKVLGEEHPLYAQFLNNLAVMYSDRGDFPRAEPLLKKSLEIRKKALGEEHPHFAESLNNLAFLYKNTGDDQRAEPLLKQALEIWKKVLGEEHPLYAQNLNNLAVLYSDRGDFPRAEPLLREALEIMKKAFGEEHPGYANCLINMGGLCEATGDDPQAERHFRQALAIHRKNLDLASSIQSERQQLEMTREFRRSLNCYLSLTTAWKDSSQEESYRQAMPWKGAVFSRQSRLRLLRAKPELAPLFSELENASSRLAALVFSKPDPARKDIWSRQVAELTDRKEEIEKELSRRSAGFRRAKELERLSPRDLQASLPEKGALVDVFEYMRKKERCLLAFVLGREGPVLQIDLGPAKLIEGAIDAWRSAIASDPGSKKEAEAATKLRKTIWEPIEERLGDARLVLVSPDGALGRFPLSALPGSKPGTYLIEECSIALVPVPQLLPDLLAGKKPGEASPSLLLIGDVDFGAEPLDLAQASTRGGRLLTFKPLDFTRGEILMVGDTFEKAFRDGKLLKLRDQAATESAVRGAAPKNEYIHLATHGFFAPQELKSALEPSKKGGAGEAFHDLGPSANVTGWHPGLLAGIVLAGANRGPESDADDGILTALEMAGMDLSRTELLVLSACETGLGATAGGEGLLGLQRAAQVAGARTAIASLWKVDDRDAQSLMARFYENLWKKKMGKLEALREAQLAMLRGAISRGPAGIKDRSDKDGEAAPAPARSWAAWVLSGDWR